MTRTTLTNGRILLPDQTIIRRDISILEEGTFDLERTSSSGRASLNLKNHLVLPGIIDIHGDAFERQLMPRPGVMFSYDLALMETDRQMIANGITTAFHGLTYSWEPGLRGEEAASRFLRELETIRPSLFCDTRLHLRFETYNLPALEEVEEWIISGRVDLLAFNDHIDLMHDYLDNHNKMSTYVARTGLSKEEFIDLLTAMRNRKDRVPEGIQRLANAAREQNIPMASHDDTTPSMRSWYHSLGCRVSEFPLNTTTARTARKLGDPIVLGAPNVLRGGSHADRLSAVEAVRENLCQVLTSDYFYPSLLQAPFLMNSKGLLPLEKAWDLVSKNPAKAALMEDRGEIASGKRADLVIVDDTDPGLPKVVATFVRGTPVYFAGDPFSYNGCRGY